MSVSAPVLAAHRTIRRQAAAIGVAFAAFYSLLRSNDIFAVDGSHRAFAVYRSNSLLFGGTNHLLFPANVWIWTRMLALLGVRSRGPLSFLSRVELMNCFAAAGCLVLLYALLHYTAVSPQICMFTTVGCGFTTAFVQQATNANEPIVGIFWSLAGVCLTALTFRRDSLWLILASGFCFAAAMSTYESTVFLAPVAVVLISVRRTEGKSNWYSRPALWKAYATLAIGYVTGVVVIYGLAYYLQDVTTASGMLGRFFVIEGSGVYSGISAGKVLNVAVGLVRSVFPILGSYSGIRALMAGPRFSLVLFLGLLALLGVLLGLCIATISRAHDSFSHREKIGLVACGTGLAFTMIPVIWWDPNYGKLWLQPLICLTCFVAIVLSRAVGQQRLSGTAVTASLVLLLAVSSNIRLAVYDHYHTTWGLTQATEVATLVHPHDIVVGGWDNVSMLYADLFARNGQFIDFPSAAVSQRSALPGRLWADVIRTKARGGRVYFVDLLETPRPDWDSFLARRCGVPFSAINFYRQHSRVLMKWSNGKQDISFQRLDLSEVP